MNKTRNAHRPNYLSLAADMADDVLRDLQDHAGDLSGTDAIALTQALATLAVAQQTARLVELQLATVGGPGAGLRTLVEAGAGGTIINQQFSPPVPSPKTAAYLAQQGQTQRMPQ